jgi:hypothetical protein
MAQRGVPGLVVLPSALGGRAAAALRRQLLDCCDGRAASETLAPPHSAQLAQALDALRDAATAAGRSDLSVEAPGSLRPMVVRLAPTGLVPRQALALTSELVGLVALTSPGTALEVMHCAVERAAMTKHRLHAGDAMLRGPSCRAGWTLAVPPLRPPLLATEDAAATAEDDTRFLMQVFLDTADRCCGDDASSITDAACSDGG